MRAFKRAGLLAAGLLLAWTAMPVAANGLTTGYVTVTITIEGYTAATGQVATRIDCAGMAEPIWFDQLPGAVSSTSDPFEVPVGHCSVQVVGLGDPGALGEWGEPRYEPGDMDILPGETSNLAVVVPLFRNDRPPEWDVYGGIGVTITVDRILLDRLGRITASGRLWCPTAAEWPIGEMYVGVAWDATQYLGRRSSVHGGYQPDVAAICSAPGDPSFVGTWETRRGAADGAVWWVLGTEGKFASGTILIETSTVDFLDLTTQWWDPSSADYDPACSPEPNESGFYDANGDGYCRYGADVYGRWQYAVKTTPVSKAR